MSCCNHYLCHVKRAFLLFYLLWGLTRLLVAFPPRGPPSSPNAIRSAHRPMGPRCTGSRCCCSAFGSSQRELTPLFVRHIAQIFSYCSLCILSTPYLYIETNYILCFFLVIHNMLCFLPLLCSQLRPLHLRKFQRVLVPVRDLLR